MPNEFSHVANTEPTVKDPHSQPAAAHRNKARWLVFLLIILFAGAAGYLVVRYTHAHRTAGNASRSASTQPPTRIATAVSKKGPMGVYVDGLGLVTPLNTVAIRSRVEGQLVDIHYREGQWVQQGAALADIDPAPYQAALTQAEGQLARDQAMLENARLDFDRYREAYSRHAVPKQQLDTQLAVVHQFEGTLRLDQGMVDNARVQRAYCNITAPISGQLGIRLVDPGNIVHPNDTNPLVILTQLAPISVVFTVAEDFLPEILAQVRQGQKLAVDAYDRSQEKRLATGRLDTVDNQIDTSTGTIKLKALFENKDHSLFPNQFVNARVLVDTYQDATLIPTSLIQHNAQGGYVYVVGVDHKVSVRPVRIKATEGNSSAVEGLEPGLQIAADGFNRLVDGMKVEVRAGAMSAEAPGKAAP